MSTEQDKAEIAHAQRGNEGNCTDLITVEGGVERIRAIEALTHRKGEVLRAARDGLRSRFSLSLGGERESARRSNTSDGEVYIRFPTCSARAGAPARRTGRGATRMGLVGGFIDRETGGGQLGGRRKRFRGPNRALVDFYLFVCRPHEVSAEESGPPSLPSQPPKTVPKLRGAFVR